MAFQHKQGRSKRTRPIYHCRIYSNVERKHTRTGGAHKMTVGELIAALQRSFSLDADVTVIDERGEEIAPILTVDEDGPGCGDEREVHIVLEWQGGL